MENSLPGYLVSLILATWDRNPHHLSNLHIQVLRITSYLHERNSTNDDLYHQAICLKSQLQINIIPSTQHNTLMNLMVTSLFKSGHLTYYLPRRWSSKLLWIIKIAKGAWILFPHGRSPNQLMFVGRNSWWQWQKHGRKYPWYGLLYT